MSVRPPRSSLERLQAHRFHMACSNYGTFDAWVLPNGDPVFRGVYTTRKKSVPANAIAVGRYQVPGAITETFLDDLADALRGAA